MMDINSFLNTLRSFDMLIIYLFNPLRDSRSGVHKIMEASTCFKQFR